MVIQTCCFITPRLLVWEWHLLTPEDWVEQDLASFVVGMLTEGVTRLLPTGWQGAYNETRARRWIEERDREGSTLLVIARAEGLPVGPVILSESGEDSTDAIEIRLGYLIAEAVWGEGLASELVCGLVEWCNTSNIASVVGVVDRGNAASRRVLEKNGFVRQPNARGAGPEEQTYRLRIQPR